MRNKDKNESVEITKLAANKISELMKEDGHNFLRVAVSGGGCSGFQYIMKTEKEKEDSDKVFESNGIKIIVDPISLSYVKGAEIDISNQGAFTVKNPNATSTCGCGSSFSA